MKVQMLALDPEKQAVIASFDYLDAHGLENHLLEAHISEHITDPTAAACLQSCLQHANPVNDPLHPEQIANGKAAIIGETK